MRRFSESKPSETTPSMSSCRRLSDASTSLRTRSTILRLPSPTPQTTFLPRPSSLGTMTTASMLSPPVLAGSTMMRSCWSSQAPLSHMVNTPDPDPTTITPLFRFFLGPNPGTKQELRSSSSWSSLRTNTPRRTSVTARVVPPVLTHCLGKPLVLSSDGGSGVIDET